MKHIPTIARLLLGLIFTVFGSNMWLHFIPIPPPPDGAAKDFMFALYGSDYLTVAKVLEVAGRLPASQRALCESSTGTHRPSGGEHRHYHVFLVKGGYPMAIVLGVLSLVALAGRKNFMSALLAAN